MGEDTEHYRANRSRGDRATVGHLGVHHDNGEYDTCKSPGTEPAHKKLSLGAHPHTGEAEKYRQHSNKGQTQNGIERFFNNHYKA